MLTAGIFCVIVAIVVFSIGILGRPSLGGLSRWYWWRLRVGGAVGIVCGIVLIIAGILG